MTYESFWVLHGKVGGLIRNFSLQEVWRDWPIDFGMIGNVNFDFDMIGDVDFAFDFGVNRPLTLTLA